LSTPETKRVLGSRPAMYGMAVVLAMVAFALKVTVAREIPATYLLFLPVVFAAAGLGGLGPGVVATFVAAALINYRLLEPVGSLQLARPEDVVALALFVVMGIAVSVGAHVIRRRNVALRALQKSEAALAESERRLKEVVEGSSDGYFVRDLRTGIAFRSACYNKLHGHPAEDTMGDLEAWKESVHLEDVGMLMRAHQALVDGQAEQLDVEYRTRLPGGEWEWRRVRAKAAGRDGSGSATRISGMVRDVHALRLSEEALRGSEARLRTIVENSADAIYLLDITSNRFILASPSQERITGFTDAEMMAMTRPEVLDRVHPDDRPIVEDMNARLMTEPGVSQQAEFRWKVKSGDYRWRSDCRNLVLDAERRPVAMVGITRDISEQRALQAQLQVASRLAALGTLVAGVAHEVNNPLAGAMAGESSAAETIRDLRGKARRRELADQEAVARELDEVLEDLADVEAGTQRIARIVKDLTAFGRVDQRKNRIRLIDAVDDALRWARGSASGHATIQVENLDAPAVLASIGQVSQVVVNLVTNAARSIPDGRKGLVTVRVSPGSTGMARLEVEDNGLGMAREVMDRMFDPFFTTREVGHGMGLGLAVTYAIVKGHGGTITATSEIGKGTTFRVELPVAAGAAS
jgi:two-component system cell cycle sensor histidine kinase/response regulator CckA